MTLPWLMGLFRQVQQNENRLRAAIISGVNLGYCGSRDKEAGITMREVLAELQL